MTEKSEYVYEAAYLMYDGELEHVGYFDTIEEMDERFANSKQEWWYRQVKREDVDTGKEY